MMQKSIFGNKRPKWPSVYILGHQLAYMGQSIRGLSQFILIGTFSGPNPLSLRLLITCLLTVIDLTDGNLGQKSSLGVFCFKVFILASFFLFCLFLVLILFLCVVQVYACFLRLVLQFFLCSEHVWLLESGFLIMLFFLLSASMLGFSNNSHTCMP